MTPEQVRELRGEIDRWRKNDVGDFVSHDELVALCDEWLVQREFLIELNDAAGHLQSILDAALSPAASPVAAPSTSGDESWKMFTDSYHDLVVVMQAAYIEWRHGEGAETAMQWIANTLDGPDLIPDSDEPYSTEAQKFYDLNKSHPMPPCDVCGGPSTISGDGKGWCLDHRDGAFPAERQESP